MNKKIISVASVFIALLLVVLIVSENNEFEMISINAPHVITDVEMSKMEQALWMDARYKQSRDSILIIYKDESMKTDKLIIEILGLPQTYHKEFVCTDPLAKNEKRDENCPDFVATVIKIDSEPKYGWESIPVVFFVEHQEFGKITMKTEIYGDNDPKPRIIYSPT